MSEMTLPMRAAPRRRITAREQISARERLEEAFRSYKKAVKDSEFCKTKVAEAQAAEEAAEEAAFNDESVSDQEVWDKSQAVETAVSICSQREAAVKPALERFETAISAAQREYIGMQIEEFGRRREIIAGRVIEAMQADTSTGLLGSFSMNELLESSRPLIAIKQLAVPPFYVLKDNPGPSVESARYLLEKFEELKTKKLEKI